MDGIEKLQQFFIRRCDGDWEHGHGISITTLDNPGWAVRVDIEDFEQRAIAFEPINIERSKTDWIYVSKDQQFLRMSCGAANLGEGIGLLMKILEDWER